MTKAVTRRIAVGIGTAFLLVAIACGQQESDRSDTYAYGFAAPGLEPELFAFDLVGSDAAQIALGISPNGDELYFTQISMQDQSMFFELLQSQLVDDEWTAPEPAPFASEYGDMEAFFNVSGDRLYFFSNRPSPGTHERVRTMNLWYMERDGASWSEPKILGQPDRFVAYGWSAALLDDTTLYFTARPNEDPILADIFEVSIAGDTFGEPRGLAGAVNTSEFPENEPAIAPDGNYLVFFSAGRPDNLNSGMLGDLYISFRGEDGSWMEPMHIDEPINSPAEENWPRISPDGRFLFFSSDRREGAEMPDLYWVSTQALERYRPN